MDPVLVVGGVVLWLAIFAMMHGVRLLVEERNTLARRLITGHEVAPSSGLEPDIRVSLDDGFLKRFERIVTPQNPEERSQVQKRLVLAGYRNPSAVRLFYFSRAMLTIAMTVVAAFIVPALAHGLPLFFSLSLI